MGSCSATELFDKLSRPERYCYICGKALVRPGSNGGQSTLTREHVIPKATGVVLPEGIVPACLGCNSLKGCIIPTASYLAALRFKVNNIRPNWFVGDVFPINFTETLITLTVGSTKFHVLLGLVLNSSATYSYFSVDCKPHMELVKQLSQTFTNATNRCGWTRVPLSVRNKIRGIYATKPRYVENTIFPTELEMREAFGEGLTFDLELSDTVREAVGASITSPSNVTLILEPKNPQHSVVSPEPTVVSSTQHPEAESPPNHPIRVTPDPSILSGLQGPPELPETPRTKSLSEAEELDQIVMSFAVDFAKTLTKFFKEKEVPNPVDALTESIARLSNQPACCVYGERDNQFVLPGF